MTAPVSLVEALRDRYTIERELGRGGMATVYLAQDLRHRRRVAVKVLRPELGAVVGTERFLAEIEVTANLQHSHLLPLFDSGEANGLLYYVMPFVDGETLRHRLSRERQLGIDETVRITRAVASALDYAHRRGVIHRDLKPENILLREGEPLVADFGIALALSNAAGERITQSGISLGTPQYMSPEQAAGDRMIDSRSDQYSLACVVYEMLAGEPPHTGPTVQAVVSKVMSEEPRPIEMIRNTVPEELSSALAKALAKVPADRFGSVREFANALEEPPASIGEARHRARQPTRRSRGPHWPLRLAVASAALLALSTATLALLHFRASPAELSTVQLQLLPPEHTSFTSFAMSPDGRRIAFTAADSTGRTRLYVRALDGDISEPLRDTDVASYPFWSPDSRLIGFFADNKLKKIDPNGGAPITLCPLLTAQGGPRGGTWNSQGIILFAVSEFHPAPIYQVSDQGGEARPVTTLEASLAQSHHFWPTFLPDGRHFVYYTSNNNFEDSTGVWVASLDQSDARFLFRSETGVIYAGSGSRGTHGHLLFARDGQLVARDFDTRALRVGDAMPIAPRVGSAAGNMAGGQAKVSASENGVMVYGFGGGESQLTWVDRKGTELGTIGPVGIDVDFRISPNGRRVAAQRENSFGKSDIFLLDVGGGPTSRLTFGPSYSAAPVWSPDGQRIAFFANRDGRWSIWQKSSTAEGEEELLLKSPGTDLVPNDWSPEGKHLLFSEIAGGVGDICVLTRGQAPQDSVCAAPFANSPATENFARFSPDGRWVAYYSNQSGRFEINVRKFPPQETGAGGQPVSLNGGIEPRWSGNEIFYIAPDNTLMAQRVRTSPTFESVGAPQPLFRTRPVGVLRYDVTADGQRFLVAVPTDEARGAPLTVVLNWPEQLNRTARK
jgi:serine/threonine-protein kinase